MKSILQSFIELEQTDWDYYDGYKGESLINPFKSSSGKETHEKFIEGYFHRGCKDEVIEINEFLPEANFNKLHTTSIFFLGALIFKNTEFKDLIKPTDKNKYTVFSFIWFLSSLFHDYAYSCENDPQSLKKMKDFDSMCDYFGISCSDNLIKEDIPNINSDLFKSIKNYYNFRSICQKKIDHGIVAGMYLYYKLVKIRKEKEQANCSGLNWSSKLEKSYALAAASVAVHNIWIPGTSDYPVYQHFGLENLIDFKPINKNESPLLYLLGIVDTIDPVKIFSDCFEVDYILKNLEINFTSNSLTIANSTGSELDFKLINKKVDNLLGWLNVSLTKKTNSLQICME